MTEARWRVEARYRHDDRFQRVIIHEIEELEELQELMELGPNWHALEEIRINYSWSDTTLVRDYREEEEHHKHGPPPTPPEGPERL